MRPDIVCHDLHAMETAPTTIVIVDDHPSFRRCARAVLEADGFAVVGEAEDGEGAITAIGELHPDAVLLDVQLPDMDGFAVLRLAYDREPVRLEHRTGATAEARVVVDDHDRRGRRLHCMQIVADAVRAHSVANRTSSVRQQDSAFAESCGLIPGFAGADP